MASMQDLLSRPADEYVNDPTVEMLWAEKAMKHAEIYYNLITTVDPRNLKLTKHDDRIYEDFKKTFPKLNIADLTVDDLKSESQKEIWRTYCEAHKDIDDFSYGTLLRLNARLPYSEENTILATRIIFFAIEIARNRQGINNYVWENTEPLKYTSVIGEEEQRKLEEDRQEEA